MGKLKFDLTLEEAAYMLYRGLQQRKSIDMEFYKAYNSMQNPENEAWFPSIVLETPILRIKENLQYIMGYCKGFEDGQVKNQ